MKRMIVASKIDPVDLKLSIQLEIDDGSLKSIDKLWNSFAKNLEKVNNKITWTYAEPYSIVYEDSFGGNSYYLLELTMKVEVSNSSNPKKELEIAFDEASTGKFSKFANCAEFDIR